MNGFHRAALLLPGLLALAACGNPPADTAAPSSAAPVPPAAPRSAPAPSSPQPAASSLAEDLRDIRAAGKAKDQAYAAGNAGEIASLYEKDAVLMPPTAQMAKGQPAISRYVRDYVSRLTDSGYTAVIGSAVDIGVSGNLGFRSGTYSIKDKSGAKVDYGKWLELWNKSNGKWRISRDIWNSDTLPLVLSGPDEDGAPAQ